MNPSHVSEEEEDGCEDDRTDSSWFKDESWNWLKYLRLDSCTLAVKSC